MLNSRFYLEIFFQSTKKSFTYSVLQNLYDGLAFIEYAIVLDKKKHEDGVTVTVKLACDKDIVAAAEYSFSESDQSAYQGRPQSPVILITQAKII